MAKNAYPTYTNIPEERVLRIRLLGANGANPTVQEGAAGLTATRTGEGAYKLAYSESPGNFVGWQYGFGAATPADCAGYTAVRDTWNSTSFYLEFVVYNSSFAAADIIADQYLDITLIFRTGGVQ
jgi:hypothetical protein